MPKSPTTSDSSTFESSTSNSPRRPSPQGDNSAGLPPEADSQGYEHVHSGRRAAGHGGGALDGSEDGGLNPGKPADAYSGGGSGHESQASQQREANEELESRNGPDVRKG